MNDPKTNDALRRLAERGTPRGADRVLRDATEGDAGVRPLDGPEDPGAGAHTTSRARYAVAAVVLALVAAGGVAYGLRDEVDTTPVATGPSNFCEVMAAPALGRTAEALVYVDPEADSSVVAGIGELLTARPEVRSIRYVDIDETWQVFNELFRDDEAMLDNVRREDLPTAYEVQLVDWSVATKNGFRDAVVRTAGVFEVTTGSDFPRVIDVLTNRLSGSAIIRSADLLDGLVLNLDDLDERPVPAEVLRDIDTVADALVDGFDDLDRDRRVEALRASQRVGEYAAVTCDLPDFAELTDITDLDLPQPDESTVGATEAGPVPGD